MAEVRPEIAAIRTGAELRRWYWLKTELVQLARLLAVSPGGSKQDLTARLCASLDGELAATTPTGLGRSRSRAAGALPEPLSRDTVIPVGQRSSQQLRGFLSAQIGPGFRFDGAMRAFVEQGAGRTLGEAVDHWYETRSAPRGEIAPQFELNRFLRAWRSAHPGGSGADARSAWRAHRATPRDEPTGDAPG